MSPRIKQKQQMIDARRKQIFSAAVKIFATRGFANTKISDIASAAGLSHGLIYHYFKTKDDVFTEIIKYAQIHFLSSIEYISKMDTNPLEKIRLFTEIVTPKDYSEENAYYSNVVLQAHTSRGLPKAVKKIIQKNISRHNDIFASLITEGQKLGQIIQGDPLKLAYAHYSMLLGMQGMHILIYDFPEYPISIIDPDTVIRALKNPEYKYEFQAVPKFKNMFKRIQLTGKLVIFRVRESKTSEFKIFKIRSFESIENGTKIFRFVTDTDTGEKTISAMQAEDLLPLYTESWNSKQKLLSRTVYEKNSVTFNIPGRKLNKTIELHGEYFDSQSIYHLFQAFPFESNDKIEFIVVHNGGAKEESGHYMMEIRKIGIEKISVPAGEFNCYKLKMTPSAIGEEFAKMYSYYFWYTVDEPHAFIKYEGSDEKLIELVKVE
jgi:AcrR family transcriptional regulator